MNIRYIVLLLFVPALLFADITLGPVNKSSAEEIAEPSQKKQNYKLWRNLLASYGSFRKVAWATLHDLNTVSSIAWTAQSTLQQLETFSNNISTIYKNIQNLSDVKDVVELVEDIETNVFQLTDPIILGSLPNLSTTMKNKNEIVKGYIQNGSATWKELKKFRDDTEKRYFAKNMNALIAQKTAYIDKKDSSNSVISSNVMQIGVASRSLANHDNYNMRIDDQAAMIAETSVRSKNNEKESGVLQASLQNRITQRNAYIVGLQFHAQLNDNINQENIYLLTKAKALDRHVYEMAIAQTSADVVSTILKEEVERIRRK